MANTQIVAILYGGRSVEHEISINSAKNVYQYIDKTKFKPILIGISKSGQWHLKSEVDGNFEDSKPLSLTLDPGNVLMYNDNERVKADIFFPVLHGTDGEDGSIQGLLQAMNIPFIGTGVLGSSLAMNKLVSKRLLKASGVPVGRYLPGYFEDKGTLDFETIVRELGLPFMAKAVNLGSSVGVVKVKSREDFEEALEQCFQFDNSILFEEYIEGRELECSVMGNVGAKASLPAEIVISKAYEFYTYEAKYLDPNAVELHVPAALNDELSNRIREISIQAYQALHCQDFARVDLFLTSGQEVLVNEINTIPGFTNSSMFPMMWKERGISFSELITQLIEMAWNKYKVSQRIKKEYH